MGRENGDREGGLARRTARWAWERDEDHPVTSRTIVYTAVMWLSVFLLLLGMGTVF